jgi:hypothetical protein
VEYHRNEMTVTILVLLLIPKFRTNPLSTAAKNSQDAVSQYVYIYALDSERSIKSSIGGAGKPTSLIRSAALPLFHVTCILLLLIVVRR